MMKSIQILFFVLVVFQTVCATLNVSSQLQCEPLKIKICQKLNYNKTVFPNFAKHRAQWEAEDELKNIDWLLKSGCSKDLIYLVCSYYAPVCTSYGKMVPPCRSLCRKVKKDCSSTIKKVYGKLNLLNCKQLPKRRKVCFGRPRTTHRTHKT